MTFIFLSQWGFFLFIEIFIKKSSTFHVTFVKLAEFDWLWDKISVNFRKNVKKSSQKS